MSSNKLTQKEIILMKEKVARTLFGLVTLKKDTFLLLIFPIQIINKSYILIVFIIIGIKRDCLCFKL